MEKCYNKTQNKALRDGNLKGLLINNSLSGVIMTDPNNTRYIERGQSRMPLLYTTTEIIERFKSKHGNKYDYSLVEYKGSDCRVSIICKKHGVFTQRVGQHAKGNNCPKCAKRFKPSTTEFITECREIHKGKFSYSKTNYKNARSKIVVTCKKHGDFLVLPRAHKESQTGGCSSCNPRARITLKEFVARSNAIHRDYYDYGKIKVFKNTRQKVLIECPKHGEFKQIADHHLHGRGCPECGKDTIRAKTNMGLSEFVKKANKIHKDKYDYSKVNYRNGYTKVQIVCPKHGAFWQRPHGHLQTKGCEQCGDEAKFNFRKGKYIRHANKNYNGKAFLYLIKCHLDKEQFYKIGITVVGAQNRFKSDMPYNYEILYEVKENVEYIWDLESRLHKLLKKYAYRPKHNFGGVTECFSEIPKNALKLLEDLKSTKQIQLLV